MNNIIKKLENEASKIQCCNCKKVIEFTDNDEYKCRYGVTSIYIERPKCKYFKRHPKYITCNGIGKIRATYKSGLKIEIGYKRGRFVYNIINKI